MRRTVRVLLLTAMSTVIAISAASAANNVRIENKSFPVGTAACTVGVYISNDVAATGLVLALEMRTATGGAYMGGTIGASNFKWEVISGSRVDNSPLGSAASTPASVTLRRYANTAAGTCLDSRGTGTNLYQTATQFPDINSPDGYFYGTVSQGDPSFEDVELVPGADADGSPSLRFVFPANTNPGTFKIDSCCVAPANVCSMTDINTAIFYMSVTTGTVTLEPSAVKELETGVIPQDYTLEQNYPNPFNAGTVIRFAQPVDGNVRIDVFNILGRKVKTLVNEFRVAGTHQTDWDGRSDDGVEVATGVYFYRITTDAFSSTRKMVLLK